MKIVKAANRDFTFYDIEKGEVFEMKGRYYMKSDDYLSELCSHVPAICLNDGTVTTPDPTTIVCKVDCELVIK